jgi:nicotinamide-nucleotide amidase
MNAEILAVGTELLLGDILNTNAQFLSQELAKLGINTYWQTVVGDNWERLAAAFSQAFSRADLVIATGGLGPTGDDITKEAAAAYFGRRLVLDEESWAVIRAYFDRLHSGMAPSNKKQAMMPEGAVVLPNGNGTAPGCLIEEGSKILALLPGPPNEARPMFLESVAPMLRRKSGLTIVSKTLKICGVGESQAEDMLKDLMESQSNPSIAPYAKTGEVWIRVTASAASRHEALELMEPLVDEARRRLGLSVYGTDGDTLAGAVAGLLMEKGLKLAVAESCTGGMLASRLVDFPGISQALLEGVVTYSNEAKMARIGVKEGTLRAHGAVSAQTAEEMAAGVARTSGADVGISTTGIAGPDGGSAEKPVGLVYIGLSDRGRVSSKELHLLGDRQMVRERAVVRALDMARRSLAEH